MYAGVPTHPVARARRPTPSRLPGGHAPVQHVHPAGPADHDVRRLQVPVNDARGRGRARPPGRPARTRRASGRVRPPVGRPASRADSVRPSDEGHGEVAAAVGQGPGLVDGDDAGVVELPGNAARGRTGGRPRSREPCPGLQLDRRPRGPGRVVGPEDDAHAAAGELVEDAEPADGLGDRARPGVGRGRSGRTGSTSEVDGRVRRGGGAHPWLRVDSSVTPGPTDMAIGSVPPGKRNPTPRYYPRASGTRRHSFRTVERIRIVGGQKLRPGAYHPPRRRM